MRRISPVALASLFMVFSAAAPTFASPFTVGTNSYNVQYVTNSGAITDPATANHALLALDFDPAHVYLFGYQWQSGSKTGYDMFVDIAANPPGGITYDLPFTGFIAGIDYAGNITTDNYDPDHYSTWAYFMSNNGGPFIYPPDFGAADRFILNGSIDDWTLLTLPQQPPDFGPTRQPTPLGGVPVPEPASLGLLAMGGLLLVRRRK